jgi:phospholipid/cholesterol/gamma-HCH transport system substrate-binding protein
MSKQRRLDVAVGLFMLLGLCSLFIMVTQVSGLEQWSFSKEYTVSADFTNVGGLKVRAPVTIAGVKVGEVTSIELLPGDLNARVRMRLHAKPAIPYDDISARILTEGLLGSNYVSLVPGFDSEGSEHPFLRQGDHIVKTQEAIVLENLIGQLLFSIKK